MGNSAPTPLRSSSPPSPPEFDDFHAAIQKGDYDLVVRLLQGNPALSSAVSKVPGTLWYRSPPLLRCVHLENSSVVNSSSYASSPVDEHVYLKIAELLLKEVYTFDKNFRSDSANAGYTALHFAAEYANLP